MPRLALALALILAVPAMAGEVEIADGRVVVSSPVAKSGGVYFTLRDQSGEGDRLLSVSTDVARSAMLHDTVEGADGVVRMRPITDGVMVPPGGEAVFARGARHVMLMGLASTPKPGDEVELILHFEKAGAVPVALPVTRR